MTIYYEEPGIRIYHGKAEDVLPTLGRFDLLLTDPPYGINADRDRNCPANGWRDYGTTGWDKTPISPETIALCRLSAAKQVIWGGNYFALPPSQGWLVWDKMQRDFSLADGELAWTSENRATRIFDYSRAQALQDVKSHPTQKPLALMKWCLSLFPDAKTCLDPFGGSGTTAVACKAMGLQCTLIEQEEKYCQIAVERLRQECFAFGEAAS